MRRTIRNTLLAAAGLGLLGLAATAQEAETDTAEAAIASEGPIAAAFDMKRCVNMGNSLEAPRGETWGKPINVKDFPKIKSMGFDTVRIPVRWSDYVGEGPDYAIEPEFMTTVQTAVQAALDADLNVILNIHHYEEIMQDPRAEFRQLVAMWRQIATAFADAPDDLWFEVLNEPHTNLNGPLTQAAQTASVLAIRESNPDRIVILGGDEWSGIRTLGTNIAPPDNNIVYTFHFYDPFSFTHQKASWLGDAMPKGTRGWGSSEDKAELAAAVETATAFRDAVGHPLFLGEFGVYDEVKNKARVKWIRANREAWEDADIPWCLWAYSNTFALYDNDKRRYDEAVVEALGVLMPE